MGEEEHLTEDSEGCEEANFAEVRGTHIPDRDSSQSKGPEPG